MSEDHRPSTAAVFAFLLVALFVPRCLAQTAPQPTPEELGFSSEKLRELDSVIQGHIDKGELAGVAVLIGRGEGIAHFKTYGYQDIENRIETKKDSIFRLASITKLAVSVAALICYEDGLFLLDDPVRKHIPEFVGLRVLASQPVEGGTGSLETEPLQRDVTVRDLLRHTAGFLYVDDYPMKGTDLDTGFGSWNRSLKAFVEAITKYPLAYQPGSKWRYSYSHDVLGYLLEVVTKRPLDEFMQERVFAPLGMEDTGFFVPAEKLDRLTSYYEYEDGSLVAVETRDNSPFRRRPSALSGGGGWSDGYGGLVSTAPDYSRLLQMVVNYGELDGTRILTPPSVELMITSQVYGIQDRSFLSDTFGYGLGVGASLAPNHGPTRSILWSGGPYNTRFVANIEKHAYGIFLTQTGPWGHLGIMNRFTELAGQAFLEQ
jgi:CubicO group peptidase (beta-lactamase class C family)